MSDDAQQQSSSVNIAPVLVALEVWLFELVVRAVTKVDPAKIAADMQQWAQQNAIAAIAHDPGIISER